MADHGRKTTPGAVSAGSPSAAAAGAEVLAQGGNAIDAAIAATLAMGVIDPANASLAGRCHLLAVWPNGRSVAIDGRTLTPRNPPLRPSGSPQLQGALVVPVPGNPRTLAAAQVQYGDLPLADLVAPAHRLASEGYKVQPRLAAAWEAAAPLLAADATTARYFLHPDGRSWRAGEVRRQPALASAYADYAHSGPEAIMSGPATSRLIAYLNARGSTLDHADFDAYAPIDSEVLRFAYRDWTVWTIGRQGYGYTLAETLGILSHFDLAPMAPGERWTTVALAQAIARRDRPAAEDDPIEHLIEPDFLGGRARLLEQALASGAEAVRALMPKPPATPAAGAERRGDTTHIAAIDSSGLAASITTSIGPHFGALVAAPEHGFMLAHSYRLAEGAKPSQRDRTEMLPTIIASPHGHRFAIGAAGSSRIPGGVLRTIIGIIDRGMTAAEAVAEPPVNWHDGVLKVHADLPVSLVAQLSAAGFPARRVGRSYLDHSGLVHTVGRLADASFQGGADPAWDGAVVINGTT